MDFGSEIPTDGPATVEMVNATKESFDEDDLAKFQELLLDAEKPLYKGFHDFTKLSAIVKLLNLKGKYGASDKFFTELLGLLKKMLPTDSHAWRTIDEKFPEIAKDLRNLRLGILADGVDVNSGTRHHSVWPDLSVIYNLPPWLCMKRKFIMLSWIQRLCSMWEGYTLCWAFCLIQEKLAGHRRYLPYNHPFRRQKKAFNGQQEFQLAPNPLTGEQIYNELRYWRHNSVPHCIDFMHVEKNVCESLVETLLNVPRKTKDEMNARSDLAELGIKLELFARQEEDKTTLPPAGYVRNKNRPEGCIVKETIVEETIKFFSEYHKTMKTIGIPPDKHVTNENEDGKPLSAGKSSEVFEEVFQKAHFHVERKLAISKDSLSETVRWISYTPRTTILKYEAYNINGYTFRTKSNDGIVYQNSGVSVEAVDLHISKEVATTRKAFCYGFYKRYGY
nr:hypothetical protein [Tanacetum cinerariifolium]